MIPLYQLALGPAFGKLHPKLQERFNFSSRDGRACILSGTMHRVWHGPAWTVPILRLMARRRAVVTETGSNIPFVAENHAYIDALGRECLSWNRFYAFTRVRRMDTYMVYDPHRCRVLELLGSHQHHALELNFREDRGAVHIHIGRQWIHERRLSFEVPSWLMTQAEGREWYDEQANCYRFRVEMRHPKWGSIFGYEGSFHIEWIPAKELPEEFHPHRSLVNAWSPYAT